MPGNYNSPKTVTCEIKEEMSNISKEDGDMTLSNSGSTDDKAEDENERMKKEWEKIKNMDTSELDREYNLYRNSTIYY